MSAVSIVCLVVTVLTLPSAPPAAFPEAVVNMTAACVARLSALQGWPTVVTLAMSTVILDNVTYPAVTIQNPKYKPMVIATGSTTVGATYLKGSCVIEEKDPTTGGEGYADVIYSPTSAMN